MWCPTPRKNIWEPKYDHEWHYSSSGINVWVLVKMPSRSINTHMSMYRELKQKWQHKPDVVFFYIQILFQTLSYLFQKSCKIHNTEDLTTGNCICCRQLYSALLIALLLFAPKKLHKLHTLYLSGDFIMLHQIFHPQSLLHIFTQINTLTVNVVVFI